MRRNAGFLLAGRLASAITTLIVLAVVSRLRGPEALGEVGLGLAIGTIAAAISDVGTSSLLIREASRDPGTARAQLRAGFLARLVLVLPLLLATYVIAVLSGAAEPQVVVLVAAGLVLQLTAELTRSVFNAQQRMGVSGGHAIVENLAWFVVVCGALVAGADLTTTFVLGILVWLGSVAGGLFLVQRLAALPAATAPARSLAETVRVALPFGAFSLIGILYGRIDTVLLGLLLPTSGLTAAGAYYAAARLISAFEYLPDALSRAVYPQLSRLAVQEPARVRVVLGDTATSLLALACLGPVVLATGSDSLMTLLFGPGLAASGLVLAVLSFVLPFRFLGYLFGMTLTSSDAQGRRVAAAALALVAVLAIDLVGIPRLGIAAAVAGALTASFMVFATYAWSVARRFGSTGLGLATTVEIVGGMVIALAIGLTLGTVVGQLAAAAIAGAVYLIALGAGPLRPVVRRFARMPGTP